MALCVTSKILLQRDGEPVPFGERLRFLTEAGFSEIDFGFMASALLAENWREVHREQFALCRAADVRVRYVHLPYDYPKPEDAAAWEDFYLASCRAMELAAEAGADCAAIHPRAYRTRNYDPEREYAAALRFLTPYRDRAAELGLPLALENMRGPGRSLCREIFRFGTETADTIRLADELGIGICWDAGHANISGQPQYDSLRAVGGRLRMVHLNDNFGEDDIHLAPFLGDADWESVIAGLRAAGYRGSVNLEVTCNRFPGEMQPAYAACMAAAGRRLERMLADAE